MELRRKHMDTIKEGKILNSSPSVVVLRTKVDEMMAASKEDTTALTSNRKRNKTEGEEEGGVSATPTLCTDDDDELGPLLPSTKMQKLSRRLGREKQLQAMRKLEQSDSRRERYLKRQRIMEGRKEEIDYSPLEDQDRCELQSSPVKKQVKWNETVKYHSYTPEPAITCNNSYTN
uniref:Uncharacterized protein n=1 Tax=Amphimedon queenslandica TaxID=400682 RepID=A0A1X7U937_AMPQE